MCVPILHKVHILGTVGMDRARAVTTNDVFHPIVHKDLTDRDSRGSHTVEYHLEILGFFSHNPQRINQRGEGHDRCAVLIIVKHRYIEFTL